MSFDVVLNPLAVFFATFVIFFVSALSQVKVQVCFCVLWMVIAFAITANTWQQTWPGPWQYGLVAGSLPLDAFCIGKFMRMVIARQTLEERRW
jgi:hypothetical protein